MLDPTLLKTSEGISIITENLRKRGASPQLVEKLAEISRKRGELISSSEGLQSQRNQLSKEIGGLQKSDPEKAEQIKERVKELIEQLKTEKEELQTVEGEFSGLMEQLPNVLDNVVPEGKDEQDNQVLRQWGEIPQFDFTVKPHYEIAEEQQLIDFERGVRLSGSRFYVYNEEIAYLERKLIDFMLDQHRSNGYKERTVPLLVNDDAMKGTGQLPKFAEEFYRLPEDGLNLIPTAEVPLTNLYADEILTEDQLPLYLTAATACFRREAGSAGRDTRGIIRVHQFQKVELVKFVKPDESQQEHEKLTADAEQILQKLGLTYRVLLLCSGDTSFSSSKTYDLEVWMPGANRWVEISSCSNFVDFQARRAKIRYKDQSSGKNLYLHTLNGSGVAAGRLIAALLEYHQLSDGTVDFEKIYSML